MMTALYLKENSKHCNSLWLVLGLVKVQVLRGNENQMHLEENSVNGSYELKSRFFHYSFTTKDVAYVSNILMMQRNVFQIPLPHTEENRSSLFDRCLTTHTQEFDLSGGTIMGWRVGVGH